MIYKKFIELRAILIFIVLAVFTYFIARVFTGVQLHGFSYHPPNHPLLLSLLIILLWPAYVSLGLFLAPICPPEPFEYGCEYIPYGIMFAGVVELIYLYGISFGIVKLIGVFAKKK